MTELSGYQLIPVQGLSGSARDARPVESHEVVVSSVREGLVADRRYTDLLQYLQIALERGMALERRLCTGDDGDRYLSAEELVEQSERQVVADAVGPLVDRVECQRGRENGVSEWQRVVFPLPDNTVGRRRVGAPAVPSEVDAAYDGQLRSLALSLAEQECAQLELTATGDALILRLEGELEPRLSEHSELGAIADWASKLNGAIARIAGLLHLATHVRDGYQHPVGGETVEHAARIGHYYLAHALAVFDHMNADPTIEGARAILSWAERTGRDHFARRDLLANLSRAKFQRVDDLDAPLRILEQHGYIRTRPAPTRPTGGRPRTPTYLVNPRR